MKGNSFTGTIGVIGTAKNTGKTTTLSFLMKGFIAKGKSVGLTGIGYDGEDVDTITNLPKPRLYLEKGTVVATSEKCLTTTDAEYEVIVKTDLHTALGKISLVRITKPGLMVIAGPNTKNGLSEIIDTFNSHARCDLILADGSMNRISPMYILDKLIFTTGASKSTDISKLTSEMSFIENVFNYSLNTDKQLKDSSLGKGMNVKVKYSETEVTIDTDSMVDEDDLSLLLNSLIENVQKVFIPGLVSPVFLGKNAERINKKILKPVGFVFNSPVQLLLTDDPYNSSFLLSQFEKYKIKISYNHKPELSAITINPFYPNQENYRYTSSYINKEAFLDQMIKSLRTPIYNIYESGAESIFNLFL